jgi:hypothetical protein
MSAGRNIVAAVITVVAIYTVYPRIFASLRDGHPPESPRPAAPAQNPSLPRDAPSSTAPRGPEIPVRGTTSFGPDPVPYVWQERLLKASNAAQFVKQAKPAAESGNADAEFALYGAFSFCRDGMRKRSAEQKNRIPEEIWRDMHTRCDALAAEYPDLGLEASQWLDQALQAKFPRALAFSALEDVERMAGASSKRSERKKRLADARSNMVVALRSNDPAITWIAAESLPAFFPGDPRVEQANWVWRLAACEQGMICGPDAQWIHDACLMRQNCVPGETGPQYIRRVSGDFPSLLARARTLASALRNSTLDDAGFEATVTSLPVAQKPAGNKQPAARLVQ